MSSYHFSKMHMSFDDAIMSARRALERHNFRILREINMKDNFQEGEPGFPPVLAARVRIFRCFSITRSVFTKIDPSQKDWRIPGIEVRVAGILAAGLA